MPDELKKEPIQQFCSRTNSVLDLKARLLFVALFSGGQPVVFVFTPEHIKQLAKTLNEKVAALEAVMGPIDDHRPRDLTPSPIDLSKPDEEI